MSFRLAAAGGLLVADPKPYRTIAGVLRRRRPELYGSIVRPSQEAR
jgi:hypothetical protein